MNPQNVTMQSVIGINTLDQNVILQQNNELRTINQHLNQQLLQVTKLLLPSYSCNMFKQTVYKGRPKSLKFLKNNISKVKSKKR